MKTTVSDLRLMIESLVLENIGLHRCMAGNLVQNDSEECYDDVCARIDDTMFQRDAMQGGTATRSSYNGVLADLRKKKRRLGKIYNPSSIITQQDNT